MSNMCMILKPLHLVAGGELIKTEGVKNESDFWYTDNVDL